MALLSAISDRLCSIPLPKSANVAVIHNEARVREQALSALRDAGHGVSGFADPMKALDAISSISYPRVLVTGIHFGKGKVHGIALARMVRFKWPTTGVVFIGRPENQPHADGLG